MAEPQHPALRKYVIAFNGPPHSGKDQAVKLAEAYIRQRASYMNPVHLKIAEPLKKSTHAIFDVFSDPSYYEKEGLKDKPSAEFLGRSPRQAYIEVSEEMVKPRFGKDFYGQLAAKRIRRQQHHLMHLISDGGFIEEMEPIVDLVGGKSMMIVELRARRGGVPLTFEGDSRSYIGELVKEYNRDVTVLTIPNDYSKPGDRESLEIFNMLLMAAIDKFMKWTPVA